MIVGGEYRKLVLANRAIEAYRRVKASREKQAC